MKNRSHDLTVALVAGRLRDALLGGVLAMSLTGCAVTRSYSRPPAFSQALAASARAGNPRAELNLGILLMQHAHSRRRRSAAARWIRRAAIGNLASAQDRLGLLYLRGEGVRQNTALALKWITGAARRGAPAAQLQLGHLYAAGVLVPLDRVRAYYWYAVAARTASSDIRIENIAQVHAFAWRHCQRLATWISPAQRALITRRAEVFRAVPSVPYSGVVQLAPAV